MENIDQETLPPEATQDDLNKTILDAGTCIKNDIELFFDAACPGHSKEEAEHFLYSLAVYIDARVSVMVAAELNKLTTPEPEQGAAGGEN